MANLALVYSSLMPVLMCVLYLVSIQLVIYSCCVVLFSAVLCGSLLMNYMIENVACVGMNYYLLFKMLQMYSNMSLHHSVRMHLLFFRK